MPLSTAAPEAVPRRRRGPSRRRRGASQRRSPLLALALALALLPFALLALDLLLHHGGIALGGDQAVIELATREAADGERSVGAYSRYGWSHPGPVWFYLLAPVYLLLGQTSVALYAAVLVLQAGVAALLVLVTHRIWGPVLAVVTGAAVALVVAGLPAGTFTGIWNPYALPLPLLLLVVVAAAACTGRPVAAAGAALTGTFLVQTHIGTVPVVGAVAVAVALGGGWQLLRRRIGTGSDRRAPEAHRRLTAVLVLTTALAWVPPLIQELRAGTGNLALLRAFQAADIPGQDLSASVAALGAQLMVLPALGHGPQLPAAADALGVGEAFAVGATLALAGLLLVWALRAGRPASAAVSGLVGVLVLAAVAAGKQVEGSLYPYLLVWQPILPVPLVLVAVDLLLHRRPGRARRIIGVSVALGVVGALVAAVTAPPLAAESRYGVRAALAQTLPLLGSPGAGVVRVRIASSDSWPLAAGLVLGLERRGFTVRVTEDWTFMFGPERAASGQEDREVLLVQQADPVALPPLADARELAPVTSSLGATRILVRDPAGDAAVPPLPGPVTGKSGVG